MILLPEPLVIDFVMLDGVINKSKNILKEKESRQYILVLSCKQEINV